MKPDLFKVIKTANNAWESGLYSSMIWENKYVTQLYFDGELSKYGFYLFLKKLYGKETVKKYVNIRYIKNMKNQNKVFENLPSILKYRNTLIITNHGNDLFMCKTDRDNEVKARFIGPDAQKLYRLYCRILDILRRDPSVSLETALSIDSDKVNGYGVVTNSAYEFVTTASGSIMDRIVWDQKEDFLKEISIWEKCRTDVSELGFPSTLGIILEGAPGTGKTTLVKALAEKFRATLHILDSSSNRITIGNPTWYDLNISKSAEIIYIDEIDKFVEYLESQKPVNSFTMESPYDVSEDKQNRRRCVSNNKQNTFDKIGRSHYIEINTLGDLYQLIDGPKTPNGVIFIATTNHIERLPEPLVRSGRLSLHYTMNNFEKEQAIEYCNLHKISPDILLKDVTYPVQPAFLEQKLKHIIVEENMKVK